MTKNWQSHSCCPLRSLSAAPHAGIHNLNAIRWDKPDKSFRDSLKPLKRVTWPISGNKTEKNYTYDALADWCFAAADEMPNVTGFDLDDFFIARGKSVTVQTATGPMPSCPTRFPYEQLVELRKRLSMYPRPLELRVVTYDELLDNRENPGDLKPSLDLVDAITYWTCSRRASRSTLESISGISGVTRRCRWR